LNYSRIKRTTSEVKDGQHIFLPVLLPAIKQRSMPIRGWPGYSHGRVPPNIKGNMNWQMYQSQKAGLATLGNISA